MFDSSANKWVGKRGTSVRVQVLSHVLLWSTLFLPRCSLALRACTVVSRATNLRMSVAQQRASMPIISQRRRCFQHLSFFVSQKTSADECMHLLYVFSVHVDRTWKRETILWNRSGILQTPTSCVCTCTLNDQIVSSPHKKIRSKLGGQRLRK